MHIYKGFSTKAPTQRLQHQCFNRGDIPLIEYAEVC
jgi:hypothetical protein